MLTYTIIFTILLVAELLYFKVADKYNIIDKPNLRSSHTQITLLGGGVIFIFATILYATFFGFKYPWFLLGLLMISVVSFVDDLVTVRPRYRLVVHFASMLLLFQQWGYLDFRYWWFIVIGIIFCTGVINVYNFMDGINGITGGYSLSVLIPLIVLNEQSHYIDRNLLILLTMSVGIFCFFNFRKKAKCFAGDVGAVSIAFALVFLIGRYVSYTANFWAVFLLVVYGADGCLTIAHRLLLHEDISMPHRKHAYQLMANELKIPHVVVSTIYMVLQLGISLGGILLPVDPYIYFTIAAGVLCVAYVLFKMKYYHLHVEYLKSKGLYVDWRQKKKEVMDKYSE
ncbi:MAG: glycosyltransferase family 4 protein [Bacteroidales bacterium]|nr:glycosyltransferase family 4 protein [Candidatus Scybalocola fimicaballi]